MVQKNLFRLLGETVEEGGTVFTSGHNLKEIEELVKNLNKMELRDLTIDKLSLEEEFLGYYGRCENSGI